MPRSTSGFATTAAAYCYFIERAGLKPKLQQVFANLNVEDLDNLRQRGERARSLILNTPFPEDLESAIADAYKQLCDRYPSNTSSCDAFDAISPDLTAAFRHNTDVAVRSSATAEDLPDASFAGQQETYLNVCGIKQVLQACHKCFASIFTDRAISYRTSKGFDHLEVALSVGVQKMVRSDLAASGVMFSIDPETGFKNATSISAAYGLGENVVQGAVNPDEFVVFKPTLAAGFRPILSKRLGSKAIKMVYDLGGSKLTKNVPVAEVEAAKFAIEDDEILTLARWAVIIEEHYSNVRGTYSPMDIEWAKDGETGELFIVQARPETVQSQKSAQLLRNYRFKAERDPHIPALTVGIAVGDRIGQGKARVIFDVQQIAEFQPGEVLITNRTDPDEALGLAAIPCDGVGLARLEFIIANQIKVHPLALLNFDFLIDADAKRQIAKLTLSYPNKADFFVDRLAHGIATLAAAFHPRPVIVRMSDFKSNEYANLLGGKQFEPDEENPTIGWRGASRYYDPVYRDAFALECQALKRVREEMGLTNIVPMIPFCRTPDEGRRVLAEMAQHGLERGVGGLEVYVMCEVPSNVILAAEFCEIFDGFSIGSNDLTQLTLGLDRDSALVSHIFDERNPAVMAMVKMAIATVKANGRKIGICGQAPSDYPEFAKFLVEEGIDSISLNPDTVIKTRLEIAKVEASL